MTENDGSFKSLQRCPQKKTCFLGCGLGLLGISICVLGMVWLGTYMLKKSIEKEIHGLEAKGFHTSIKITDYSELFEQSCILKDSIPDKTLLVGKRVCINGTAEGDIAIVAADAEINGLVKGTLFFRGQRLHIGSEGIIEKGLNVEAQLLLLEGQVKGEIVGAQQELVDKRQTQPMDAPPKTEDADDQKSIEENGDKSASPDASESH
jgi:hypothetical protein